MRAHARRILLVVAAVGLAVPLTGCEDNEELAALGAAARQRELALAEKQAVAQNLGAIDASIAALDRELSASGEPLRPETAAEAVRAHLPPGVALDVAEEGRRLVIWSGGGATSLTDVVSRLSDKVPHAVAESGELASPHWRLELVVAAAQEGGVEPASSPSAASSFRPLPPSTWRSGRKSRELRARIDRMDGELSALQKVLGKVGDKLARYRMLEARQTELSGLDRARGWAPLLQRALAGSAPEEATFHFARTSVTVEVRKGGDIAALAKALEEEGAKVTLTEGPPARLEVTPR